MEDFITTMEIYNIYEPERIFTWEKVSVEADIRYILKSLVTKRNNVMYRLSFKEVQSAI